LITAIASVAARGANPREAPFTATGRDGRPRAAIDA
jgi:hypothetical protein